MAAISNLELALIRVDIISGAYLLPNVRHTSFYRAHCVEWRHVFSSPWPGFLPVLFSE